MIVQKDQTLPQHQNDEGKGLLVFRKDGQKYSVLNVPYVEAKKMFPHVDVMKWTPGVFEIECHPCAGTILTESQWETYWKGIRES